MHNITASTSSLVLIEDALLPNGKDLIDPVVNPPPLETIEFVHSPSSFPFKTNYIDDVLNYFSHPGFMVTMLLHESQNSSPSKYFKLTFNELLLAILEYGPNAYFTDLSLKLNTGPIIMEDMLLYRNILESPTVMTQVFA